MIPEPKKEQQPDPGVLVEHQPTHGDVTDYFEMLTALGRDFSVHAEDDNSKPFRSIEQE